jgi:hypothetical protein
MSDQTKQAMDDAIAAHLADELDNAILTGYVLQAMGTSMADLDGESTSYLRCYAERQEPMLHLGLTQYLQAGVESDIFQAQDRD